MTAPTPVLSPAPDKVQEGRDARVPPAPVMTHEEQLAEFARLVDEARMRT